MRTIATFAAAALFWTGMLGTAKADWVQMSNRTPDAAFYGIASFAAALESGYSQLSPGYDSGCDLDLDTSISPYPDNFVLFAPLDGHRVQFNKAPQPHLGETYTFILGFQNGSGTSYSNLTNRLELADFNIDNPNGATDYAYTLSVNTLGTGSTYNYTASGLLSTKVGSPAIATWHQNLPATPTWNYYGTLTLTAVNSTIAWDGDVGPSNPFTWNADTAAYIGQTGNGTVNITDGGSVSSGSCYIGRDSGSSGELTVEGAGSSWNTTYSLFVGNAGSGTLNIKNGATVSVSGKTVVGFEVDPDKATGQDYGLTGNLNFGENGGTLTTGSLHAAPSQLSGSGTINTRGLCSDVDLVFDSAHGLTQTLTLNDQGQNIALNLDLSGTNGTTQDFVVGYRGNGSLMLKDGIAVAAEWGGLGYHNGSSGVATVDGSGSMLATTREFHVGLQGSGTLEITNGGAVRNTFGFVGFAPGSSGRITVDGDGSTWESTLWLRVGYEGTGTLNITDGGSVTCGAGYIGSSPNSMGEVNVDGPGSSWRTISGPIVVGVQGNGTLCITDRGLVSVKTTLLIDVNNHGNSFINMSTGGMLALFGEADDSLAEFLGLVEGTDAIRWWNDSIGDWAHLTTATLGTDYTLEYLTTGDLAGYTLLTVGAIPEPGTLWLLATLFAILLLYGRRKRVAARAHSA